MQQETMSQRLLRAWIAGVLTLSLALVAACGGGSSEAPADTAAESAPTEEVAAETDPAEAADSSETGAETEAAESAAEESEAPAEEAAASEAEESTDSTDEEAAAAVPAVEVTCSPLEIPSFDQISGPTESDWAVGPETASATIIEYGDFQ